MTPSRLARALLFSVAAMSALAPAVASADPEVGRRYALLIGVSDWLKPGAQKLNWVDNDVVELGKLLQREGYKVTTVPNDRADRRRIVEELYKHARELSEKDTFVLYYAGHGVRNVEVNQKAYWLTYDADLSALDVEGIRLEHLFSYIEDIPAGRKLILLDHCFSGDVEGIRLTTQSQPAGAAGGTIAPRGQARLNSRSATVVEIDKEIKVPLRQGTVVIAAARDLAYELPMLKHGVFTKALLDACEQPKGANGDFRRSLPELVTYVPTQVNELLKAANAPNQTVVDHSAGSLSNMDWPFCTITVPESEVDARAAAYSVAIQTWEAKGLLTPQRRVICAGVLDKWKAAKGDPTKLALDDNQALAAIRLFADANDAAPEQLRADALNDALTVARFP